MTVSSGLRREFSTTKESFLLNNLSASAKMEHSATSAAELYHLVTAYLSKTFEDVRRGLPVRIDDAHSIIEAIVDSPVDRDEWREQINSSSYPVDAIDFLVFHHANVAIYSVCLSITMNFSREECCRVGILGLLHDIGKVRMPEEILSKAGQLTEREWKILKQSLDKTYVILQHLGPEYYLTAERAIQVNERLDGSGYPHGLRADAIDPYAQIVGLMDIYEALTSNRPYRRKWLHVDAIKEILKTWKSSFPQRYIKALIRTFSVFPINSYVKLNSGVIGKVIEVRDDLPMRPKVEIIFDSKNSRLPRPLVVDLAIASFLHITASIAEDQLPQA